MRVDRIFIYSVAGLAVSALCVGLSLWRQRRVPDLGPVATCFLAGPGLVAGCWIARLGLVPTEALSSLPEIGELRVYLVLGGLSVAWVSIVSMAKECRSVMSATTAAREENAEATALAEIPPPPPL